MKQGTFLTKTKKILMFALTMLLAMAMIGITAITASAADPPSHTDHKICGETTCTHGGEAHSSSITWTELTQAMYSSLSTETLAAANTPVNNESSFYKIPAGNYYLSESIDDISNNVLITADVNLCLNGFTFRSGYIYVQNGTLSICDCSADKTGAVQSNSGNYGIEIGMSTPILGNTPAVNIFGGTHTNQNNIRNNSGILNIYGGKITSANSSNIMMYCNSVTNIYGGELTAKSNNINISPSGSDQSATLNVYGGSFKGNININATVYSSNTAKNVTMTVNVYGGEFQCSSSGRSIYLQSLASKTNQLTANINGGKYRLSEVNDIEYFFFCFTGWVNANITKADTSGVTSSIYYDALANIKIDPENNEDVVFISTGNSVIYNAGFSSQNYKDENGTAVTSGDYDQFGKLVINGGTFKSTTGRVLSLAIAGTKAEINGGIFTTAASSSYSIITAAKTEMLITGGTFNAPDGASSLFLRGKTKIEGTPTFNQKIKLEQVKNEADEYNLDISGYTGEAKLLIEVPMANIVHDAAIGIGDASKTDFVRKGIELKTATDSSTPPVSLLAIDITTHTHKTCGDTECTHAGSEITWTALTNTLFNSYIDTGENVYKLPTGNYYLLEGVSATKDIIIEGDVSICLFDFNFTVNTNYTVYVSNGTFNLCDCDTTKQNILTGKFEFGENSAANIWGGEIKGTATVKEDNAVYNQYGGKLNFVGTGNSGTALFIYGGSAKLYGGTISSTAYGVGLQSAKSVTGVGTVKTPGASFNMYGGTILFKTGFGIYTAGSADEHKADPHTVNIYGGEINELNDEIVSVSKGGIRISGYTTLTIKGGEINTLSTGILAEPLANILVDPENDSDFVINSGGSAFSLMNNITDEIVCGKTVIKGGTYTGKGSMIIYIIRGEMVIEGGIFDNSAGSAPTQSTISVTSGYTPSSLTIKGGSFISASETTNVISGKAKIEGAPTFTGVFNVAESTAGQKDFTGYTGSAKIRINMTNTENMQGATAVLGNTESMTLLNEGWELCSESGLVKINHTAHEGDANATCTTAGTCTVCSQQYILTHTFGEWHNEIPATCSATGTKAHKVCSSCTFNYDGDGNKIDDLTIAINANAHKWNEGEITTPSTCSAEGTKTFTCTLNGEHKMTEAIAIDGTAHIWGNWTETQAPTCTEVGKETRVCSHNAAHTDTRDKAALGHDFSVSEKDEEAHWNKCSLCDATDTKTAHSYTDGICACGAEKSGLSGGAIAGIVIGSTATAGIGGFAIFWFLIKKKSWADLIAIFKK